MKSKIAVKVADKISLYIGQRGTWDLEKSEKRRSEIKSMTIPKSLPITRSELAQLKYISQKQAIDNLIASIFSPIKIIYGRKCNTKRTLPGHDYSHY